MHSPKQMFAMSLVQRQATVPDVRICGPEISNDSKQASHAAGFCICASTTAVTSLLSECAPLCAAGTGLDSLYTSPAAGQAQPRPSIRPRWVQAAEQQTQQEEAAELPPTQVPGPDAVLERRHNYASTCIPTDAFGGSPIPAAGDHK